MLPPGLIIPRPAPPLGAWAECAIAVAALVSYLVSAPLPSLHGDDDDEVANSRRWPNWELHKAYFVNATIMHGEEFDLAVPTRNVKSSSLDLD